MSNKLDKATTKEFIVSRISSAGLFNVYPSCYVFAAMKRLAVVILFANKKMLRDRKRETSLVQELSCAENYFSLNIRLPVIRIRKKDLLKRCTNIL